MNVYENIRNVKNWGFFAKTEKPKTVSKTDLKIISSIVAEFKDRTRKDIQKWRKALQQAEDPENPMRTWLHDLYTDLENDGHLESQMLIRRMATLAKKFIIRSRKTGEENEEKTKLLQKSWFYEFMTNVIDKTFYGYSVIEIAPGEKIVCELIPRRNVVPEKRFVLFKIGEEKGIYYNAPQFANYIVEVGKPKDFGVLNKIVPQLIWKRNAQQSWAEFSEKFGLPMITATSNKSDTKELAKVEAMLRKLGEAAQAVLPEGTTIDIKETGTKSDPYNIYDKQIERCNSEISKPITGGTMVTDNGSSRSQSEVHERNLDEKFAASDQQQLVFIINEDLLPRLATFGLPFTEDDEFAFDDSEKLTLLQLWTIVKDIVEKYKVPFEWISKKFNIPIEGEKEQSANANATGGAQGNFKNGLPGTASPAGLTFPSYSPVCCSKHNFAMQAGVGLDKWLNELNSQSLAILQALWDNGDTSFEVLQKAIIGGNVLQNSLFNNYSNRLKINYSATDHALLANMEYNLFHFSYARELAGLQELNQLLVDREKLEIRSFSDFKQRAMPFLEKLDDKWLRTEFNFTGAVSQNAANFQRFWKEKDSVTKFLQYQTVGDGNVRESHRALDGKIFNIEDPEARRLTPPNGWGCRCEWIQYIGSGANVMSGVDGIALIPGTDPNFLINRADTKQVFAANQFYLKYNTGDFETDINKLGHESFKQESFDKIKGQYGELKLDKTITPENVYELFKKDKNGAYMGFTDYLKRKVVLKENTFTEHTTGKYVSESELRHQLFPHVKNVLNSPDEVYLQSYAGNPQLRYVKIYNNRMLVVDTGINGESVEIKNWYTAKPTKKGESEDHARKGLLIKK